MSGKRGRFLWILEEIPQLQKQEILSGEAAEKMRLHYEECLEQHPRHLGYFQEVLTILGVALVIGGVTMMIHYHWAGFTRELQLIVAMLPLAAAACFSLFTILWGKGRIWKEFSALLTAAGGAAGIIIALNICKIPWNFEKFGTLFMVLSIPLVCIFNSISLATVYAFFLFCTLNLWPAQQGLVQFGLLALIMPYVFFHVESQRSPYRIWMRYLIMLCAAFGVINVINTVTGHTEFMLIAVGTAFLLSGWNLYEKKEPWSRNPWLFAAYFLLLVLLGIGSSTDSLWQGKWLRSAEPDRLWNYWLFTGFTLAVFAVQWPRRAMDSKRVMLILLILIGAGEFFFEPFCIRLAANIYMGIFGVVFMVKGVRRRQLLTFNGGTLMLATLLGCRFFDPALHLLNRGIGFAVIGIGILLANYLFTRALKKEVRL